MKTIQHKSLYSLISCSGPLEGVYMVRKGLGMVGIFAFPYSPFLRLRWKFIFKMHSLLKGNLQYMHHTDILKFEKFWKGKGLDSQAGNHRIYPTSPCSNPLLSAFLLWHQSSHHISSVLTMHTILGHVPHKYPTFIQNLNVPKSYVGNLSFKIQHMWDRCQKSCIHSLPCNTLWGHCLCLIYFGKKFANRVWAQ